MDVPKSSDSRAPENGGSRDAETLGSAIDHTLLDKDHTTEDVDEAVRTADDYGMNICLPPSRIERVPASFMGEVCSVVGFPLGYNDTETKVFEAQRASEDGATEVDVACNVSHLKSRNYYEFRSDVERVVEAADVRVKAIIETGLLSKSEIKRASKLCVEAGADYVKTCSGFTDGEATPSDVRTIREAVGEGVGVKASGGIRSYSDVVEMVRAGATRIGSSSGKEIIEEFSQSQSR